MADDQLQNNPNDSQQIANDDNRVAPVAPPGYVGGAIGGKEHAPETTVARAGGEAGVDASSEMVVEIPDQVETEKAPEVEPYVEKVPQSTDQLPGPVIDDYTGQVLLNPAKQAAKQIILPLTEAEAESAMKNSPIWESVRWLAAWCMRQFKLLRGRAEYKP